MPEPVWRRAMLALAALGCVSAAPRETVGLTVNSWGKPLSDWTLKSDGTGRYTDAQDIGGGFKSYRLVTKELRVGRKGYAEIARLLAPGRRYAGKALPCTRSITDLPYGEIRWGDGPSRRVRYDLGCRSDAAAPVHAGLQRAQERVALWAKTARIIETRTPKG